jgi:penicillin-binding protein 1A
VSPASPDFIPLRDVPPLFVRVLLIGEDAGFFGHRGIDLSEVPSAILSNRSGAGVTRGASTITQQLAKNLFLSREKRLGRKLQELSLALLLESTLGKERILEIYLNIIEWGPGLYGLRPAARRYFHKEPAELSPKQMAFLVALIPGPVKYQRSFSGGTPSSGFRPLIDDLLAKLHSVDALNQEQYEAALAEELLVDAGQGLPFQGPPEPAIEGSADSSESRTPGPLP